MVVLSANARIEIGATTDKFVRTAAGAGAV
jgi:hypothetical protein